MNSMKKCDAFAWCLIYLQAEFGFNSFDPIYLGAIFKDAACLPFLPAAGAHLILRKLMTSHKLPLWKGRFSVLTLLINVQWFERWLVKLHNCWVLGSGFEKTVGYDIFLTQYSCLSYTKGKLAFRAEFSE